MRFEKLRWEWISCISKIKLLPLVTPRVGLRQRSHFTQHLYICEKEVSFHACTALELHFERTGNRAEIAAQNHTRTRNREPDPWPMIVCTCTPDYCWFGTENPTRDHIYHYWGESTATYKVGLWGHIVTTTRDNSDVSGANRANYIGNLISLFIQMTRSIITEPSIRFKPEYFDYKKPNLTRSLTLKPDPIKSMISSSRTFHDLQNIFLINGAGFYAINSLFDSGVTVNGNG